MSTQPSAETYGSGPCPRCGQGRLAIQQRTDSGALYLHCGECAMGWRHPEAVRAGVPGFLMLLEEFESCDPTRELIRARGWEAFIAGTSAP